ncbi:MAG: hypothetical protein QNJ92_14660 [Alphaproteobacteria bacterium]|nr:hypothetical protein [Alphaproteobacteria bacterium]
MTDRPRRQRGRPKGSEIDDGRALLQIAESLIEGRAQNVAAAVRLIAGHDPSLIRRLQRKFRRDAEAVMAAARANAERLALEDGIRHEQLLRATQPLRWRHEHDATTQLLDALNLERQEALKKPRVHR